MSYFTENKYFLFTSIIGIGLISLKYLYGFWTSASILSTLKNKRVIITGGSSGIGLSLAKLAYTYGAKVTIIARNVVNLNNAEKEILNMNLGYGGEIKLLSLDITTDYQSLEQQLKPLIGNTDILINCAGGAVSRTFFEMQPDDIDSQMRLNYLGAAHLTRILLPAMLDSREKHHLVFVSSMAGQVGIYGFAAYSASKFALRGLAECLQMEVAHLGVSITLAFPPDTQTPGFDNEQVGKPGITKKLSSAGGLLSPDLVAHSIMKSALRGEFFSSVGVDGWLLSQLSHGMCLPQSVGEFVALVVLSPICRLVATGYGLWMRFVIYTNS